MNIRWFHRWIFKACTDGKFDGLLVGILEDRCNKGWNNRVSKGYNKGNLEGWEDGISEGWNDSINNGFELGIIDSNIERTLDEW